MVQNGFLFLFDAFDVTSLEVVDEVSVDEPSVLTVSSIGHFTSSSLSSSGSVVTSAAVKFSAVMFVL